MKPYPYPENRAHARNVRPQNKKIILFILFILLAIISFAQSGSGGVSGSGGGVFTFKDATLESGTAGQNEAVYRFPQISSDFDALVKIKNRSNSLTYLVNIDLTNTGFDKAFQPQVGYNNGSAPGVAEWWMDFEMTMVRRGTSTPVTFNDFDLTAIDIDGNNDRIGEYVVFFGLNSYTVETNSMLVQSNFTGLVNGVTQVLGKRFDGPTSNFINIDTSGTAVMVTTKYVNMQTFTIRVGGVASGASSASERMYSLYFQNFTYNNPQNVSLPVDLKSFDANLSSGKAVLNWTSGIETSFSHYIIERSFDGKDYNDVTMIFSNGQHGSDASYTYSESVNTFAKGLVYYRLKMVDIDGKYTYSPIRIIRLTTDNQVAVSTYPNPVQSELRITIPESWQSQKVSYDMFNTTGRIVKRHISERASQTETLQLADLYPGTYVIKLSSGSETAIKQIIKSR